MTIQVDQTSNTNTFQYLVDVVNELANAMSTYVVTTESNTAIGNASISNIFTANAIIVNSVNSVSVVANTLKLSNTTSNVTITIPSTAVVNDGNYYLNANGSWAPVVSPIETKTVNTSTTSTQQIDSYAMASYGAVEFFLRVKNNNANGYQATKILSFHNGVTAFSTEYGSMVSNATLGTFAVSSNSSHVILSMTPTSTNTEVTISRVNF